MSPAAAVLIIMAALPTPVPLPPAINMVAPLVVVPNTMPFAAASVPICMVLPFPLTAKLPVPTDIVIAPVLVAFPIVTAPLPTVERLVGPGFTVSDVKTPAAPPIFSQLAVLLIILVRTHAPLTAVPAVFVG